MTDTPGADERRTSAWLRSHGVGHTPQPGPTPTQQPTRERDWFDELYEDAPTGAAAQDPSRIPWWLPSKTTPQPEPQPQPGETPPPAPGVNITINQPAEQPKTDPRRARRRRWLAIHGALAAIGWYVGLGPAMTELYAASGHRAPAVGIALVLISLVFGTYLPGLAYVPQQLRPFVIYLCRIPACTAVLALALHTPNAQF